jgi:hypothetical protein
VVVGVGVRLPVTLFCYRSISESLQAYQRSRGRLCKHTDRVPAKKLALAAVFRRHLVGGSDQDRKVLAVDTRRKRRTAGRIFGKIWLPVVILVVAAVVFYGVNTVRHLSEAISNPPVTHSIPATLCKSIQRTSPMRCLEPSAVVGK